MKFRRKPGKQQPTRRKKFQLLRSKNVLTLAHFQKRVYFDRSDIHYHSGNYPDWLYCGHCPDSLDQRIAGQTVGYLMIYAKVAVQSTEVIYKSSHDEAKLGFTMGHIKAQCERNHLKINSDTI